MTKKKTKKATRRRSRKMKLLTNPGLYFGMLLAGVSMAAFLCLANPHGIISCQTPEVVEEEIATLRLTPTEQMEKAIRDARELANAATDKRDYRSGLMLLQRESKRITQEVVVGPTVESMLITGLMLLEAATIGEEFLNSTDDYPSGLDKRSCLANYTAAAATFESIKRILSMFSSQGLIEDSAALFEKVNAATEKAKAGVKRITQDLRQAKKEDNDLIPFPTLPGQ